MRSEAKSPKNVQPGAVPPPETAADIMTKDVVSVSVGASARDVALLLLEKRVSAVPVLGADRKLVGMVSDGDLIGRSDADRVARRDWWLKLFAEGRSRAETFAAPADRPVDEVMRAPVLTVDARAPLHEIARMLAVYDIKRLPVMRSGDMVGVVSRSDLVRAVAAQVPAPAPPKILPGLMSLFTGMMQTDVRPEDPPAAAPAAPAAPPKPPVTAAGFRELVNVAEQEVIDAAAGAKQNAALERLREIKVMLLEHLDEQVWTSLMDRARAAAANGENSCELMRFPCDLCSDGGRKIDVAEPDWPTTLRGEAAEIYTRWERELRPGGFRLRAQISEYLDDIPSMISLALAWAAPETNETKPGH